MENFSSLQKFLIQKKRIKKLAANKIYKSKKGIKILSPRKFFKSKE